MTEPEITKEEYNALIMNKALPYATLSIWGGANELNNSEEGRKILMETIVDDQDDLIIGMGGFVQKLFNFSSATLIEYAKEVKGVDITRQQSWDAFLQYLYANLLPKEGGIE